MNVSFQFFERIVRFFGPPQLTIETTVSVTATVGHPLLGPDPVPMSFTITGPTDTDNDGDPEVYITGNGPGLKPRTVKVELSQNIAALFVRLLRGDLSAATEMVDLTFGAKAA